jgi:hypothetical protein
MNCWRGVSAGLIILAGALPVFADGAAEQPPPLHLQTHVLQTHGPASLRTSAPVSAGRMNVAFADEIGVVFIIARPR